MSNVADLRAGLRDFWSDFLLDYVRTDRNGNQTDKDWRAYLLTPDEYEELQAEIRRLAYLRVAAPYGAILAMVHRPETARELSKYHHPIIAIEEALYALPTYPPPALGDIIRKSSETMEGISNMLDRMTQLSDLYTEEMIHEPTTDDYPSDTEPEPA